MNEERWVALIVNDEKEYQSMIIQNRLQTTDSKLCVYLYLYEMLLEFNDNSLPQTFPFSKIVPQYCIIIKNLIVDFYKFAQNLPDLDEYTRKSAESVITQLNDTWMSFVIPTKLMNTYVRSWIDLTQLNKVIPDWNYTISQLSYQSTSVHLNIPSFQEYAAQIVSIIIVDI